MGFALQLLALILHFYKLHKIIKYVTNCHISRLNFNIRTVNQLNKEETTELRHITNLEQ